MFDKKIIVGLVILLFLICTVAPVFSWGDDFKNEDIYLKEFDNEIFNQTVDYEYSVDYELCNISNSLSGAKIITTLYDEDNNTVPSDSKAPNDYNETQKIGDLLSDNTVDVYVIWYLVDFKNIDHCNIAIVDGNETVFNITEKFNMENYEDPKLEDIDYDTEDDTIEGFTSDSSSSDSGHTYVASSNSNKFHDPYCSQAQRIDDANKITFSSRQDAIDAGYEPCEICYP